MKDKAEKEAHRIARKYWNLGILSFNTIIKCSIIDVSNTIEAIARGMLTTKQDVYEWQRVKEKYYKRVKKILEDKLK